MTGRIVVGIDGSKPSGNALEWAVARARLEDWELDLVNGYTLTPAMDFYGYHGLASGQPVDWLIEHSEQVLQAAAARVRELAPDMRCTLTSKLAHPANALEAASKGADVVVVGRRGLGNAASALLGSVSNRVTTQVKCPVVVVGEGALPTGGPIVVGIDGSEFGTHALRYALAEAAVLETSVRAVAAYEPVHPGFKMDAELVARMHAEVEGEVDDTITRSLEEAQGTDESSVKVEHVVVEARPAEGILAHADDAQLIVVGTHGKNLVRRVLLGSVSRRVLHDADRPVAVVDLPAS